MNRQIVMSICLGFVACVACGTIAAQGSPDKQDLEPDVVQAKVYDHSSAGDDRVSTVGFPKLIFQHVITDSKVVVKPITDPAEVMIVRIVETYSHGSGFRYDIEYKGMEPGTFNVADFLVREDRSTTLIPPIEVQVNAILAEDAVLPNQLPAVKSRFRSYYLPIMLVGGAAWIAGLLMILFYGRGRNRRPQNLTEKPKTVAQRMRPLVDAAMAGDLDAEQQAELERLLSSFWCKKLRLDHLSAHDLREQLRKHDEASVMLRQIDSWLHRPPTDPANKVDVNEILKPYQSLADPDQ